MNALRCTIIAACLALPLACGSSSPPATTAAAPAETATAPAPAPTASSDAPPAATTTTPPSTTPPAKAAAKGTLMGETFGAQSAVASKTANGDSVLVTVYDGDVTCANKAAKNMQTARLEILVKWKKGEKSAKLSAYAKDAGIGKQINYDKKGTAEATVLDAGDETGRVHLTAKDAALKVDFDGDVDVVRCK